MTARISIIGAGSGQFSLGLVRELCTTPNLVGSAVSLMDVDEQRMEGAYRLCRRFADEMGMALDLRRTTDREEALQGADFVINSALVAGHDRLRAGWEIARRHGYRFGGSLHIMHDEAFWINFYQLRLFESLIRDMQRLCPQAWCIEIANPVLAGTTLLGRKYPNAKVVGLCHGYAAVYRLAEVVGLGRENLNFEMPGVNHFIWLTKLYQNGRDVLPEVDRWIAESGEKFRQECRPGDDLPKAIDMYRRFGAFPIGDTPSAGGGAWGWWYHVDDETEQYWKQDPALFYAEYFAGVERRARDVQTIAANTSSKVSEQLPPAQGREQMVPLIEAIACDIPRVLICNIVNRGEYVPGVPRDFSVEVPALVSKRGVQGVRTDGVPPGVLAHLVRDRVAPVNLELEAYERGDKQLLLELLMLDPWTRSERQAAALLDEILAMPVHAEMRDHYR
jgi:alpha-galactosidase